MRLVERDGLISQVRSQLEKAGRNGGRFMFLGGPAGVGKTSVVRAVTAKPAAPIRVLVGSCDALTTPRALGPLHDMAVDSPGLADMMAGAADRHDLFSALLVDLTRHPSLMAIEDVHWADEATIDMLTFLGRRIDRTRSLVIATYRDDEVPAGHPLRKVLGDLATAPGHRRVRVEPLTLDGVRVLASNLPIEPEHLHHITGGNPFYVTEVLAAPGWTVPPTVADAVIARASRLSPEARMVLDCASIEPSRTELDLLLKLGSRPDRVDEALDSGFMVSDGERIRFRHELARLAIVGGLAPARQRDLHTQFLKYLESRPSAAARLAHHARGAADHAAVLQWAARAAQEAAGNGAHHEAAAHYRDAVEAADHLGRDREALADLLGRYATELAALDRRDEVVEVRRRVVELRQAAGDPTRTLIAESDLAYGLWTIGEGDASRRLMTELVARAVDIDDDRAKAQASAGAGYLAMLSRAGDDAVSYSGRAVALAEKHRFDDVLVRALNALGSARIGCFEDLGGIEDLERSGRVALQHGSDVHHCDALENLGSALGEIRVYEPAASYLERAVEYATERDLDSHRNYGQAWLARVRFEQGAWDRAAILAQGIQSEPGMSPISPIVALTVVGRVRARRGETGTAEPLQQAWDLARQTNDMQRLWPVVAARAEEAWLASAPTEEVRGEIDTILDRARELKMRWAVGELGFWAWKLGATDQAPEGADAYRLHIAGDYLAAAQAWDQIGCPYERAWALADAGDEASLRAALDILTGLGAVPLADRVRHSLRALNATGIPTGPRRATAGHPGGLTPRQAEILELLRQGMSDREIAERLFISPKTAGHHVSAVLRKLGVSTRAQAASHANRMGWQTAEGAVGEK